MESNNKYKFIDIAKGIGILLVMFAHSGGVNSDVNKYLFASYMQMFYIISGYLIKDDILNKNFLQKKVKRLLIPYSIYSFFCLIGTIVIFLVQEKSLSLQYFVHGALGSLYSRYCFYEYGNENNIYLFIFFNAPMWFLTALFSSFVLVTPLIYLNMYNRFLLCISYFSITILLNKIPILLPWSIDTSFLGAIFILCGYVTKKYIDKYPPLIHMRLYKGKYIYIIFAFLLTIYVSFVNTNPNINLSVRQYGMDGKLGIIMTFIIGLLGTSCYILLSKLIERWKVSSVLEFLGKNSLMLLCIHQVIFNLCTFIINKSYLEASLELTQYIKIILTILLVAITVTIKRKFKLKLFKYL